jgi:hypothetical protein
LAWIAAVFVALLTPGTSRAAQGRNIKGSRAAYEGCTMHAADFDVDGDIDGRDFLSWQSGLGLSNQTDSSKGDADRNGVINGLDLDRWDYHFGARSEKEMAQQSFCYKLYYEPEGIVEGNVTAVVDVPDPGMGQFRLDAGDSSGLISIHPQYSANVLATTITALAGRQRIEAKVNFQAKDPFNPPEGPITIFGYQVGDLLPQLGNADVDVGFEYQPGDFIRILDTDTGETSSFDHTQLVGVSLPLSVPLLNAGDPILAVDVDPPSSNSNYPGNGTPGNVADGSAVTEYVNFGKRNTGLIARPQAPPPPSAVLAHRWSFNTSGQALDSVGGAHGALSGAAEAAGGVVTLPGGTEDFVNLPGAVIAINTYTDATFEGWFTFNGGGLWQRLFDFGDTNPETNLGRNYIFYTPNAEGGFNRAVVSDADPGFPSEDIANAGATLTSDVEHHVVVVVDDAANGGEGAMSVYVDGVLGAPTGGGQVNPVFLTKALSGVSSNLAFLGKSMYPIDSNLNGSINEFRIYNGAIGPDAVTANFLNGPNVDPVLGPAFPPTVRSLRFVTGDGPPASDPVFWELYGTNDPLLSGDNSDGMGGENWTLIGSGTTGLPQQRGAFGPILTLANSEPYSSYRLVFPEIKDFRAANSMQIGDVGLFESTDGTGVNLLSLASDFRAIQLPTPQAESPPDAGPEKLLDGDERTKYVNFGKENSGIIVTPSAGASTVTGFAITTADADPGHDPALWALYGTNDSISSANFSQGTSENWTLIDSGSLDLPNVRGVVGPIVAVDSAAPYKSYRLVFPSLKNSPNVDSVQLADIQFYGILAGMPASHVPEPSPLLLVGLVAVWLRTPAAARHRRVDQ